MAEIISYPVGQPDKQSQLIGTQVGVVQANGQEVNLTRNFTVQQIVDLAPTSAVKEKEVTLTSTQMLSLNGGGSIEVLPAPGAGKLLALMNVMTQVDFNSVAYNFAASGISDKISFYIGVNEASGPSTLDFNVAADTFYITDPLSQIGGSVYTPNSSLTLQASAGITVSQGDSPIKFSILYREINVS